MSSKTELIKEIAGDQFSDLRTQLTEAGSDRGERILRFVGRAEAAFELYVTTGEEDAAEHLTMSTDLLHEFARVMGLRMELVVRAETALAVAKTVRKILFAAVL